MCVYSENDYKHGKAFNACVDYIIVCSILILFSLAVTISGADPLTVKLGDNVVLRCTASGLPEGGANTEIVWIFNGQNSDSASNNGQSISRSHAINNFGIDDIGIYTCRANHPSWSNPITDTVTVQGKLL